LQNEQKQSFYPVFLASWHESLSSLVARKKSMPILYPNKLFCVAIASHPGDGIFMFAFEDDLKG
jgi:hypothetical protein